MASNTVLVIEDEPEVRELLVYSLTKAGFSVAESATAEEATNLVHTATPGLVIVDWMLPGASGIEFARQLRRDELTRELPLIMLTARSAEADMLKSFDSGFDDYITKPFSPREFVARVRALLRRSGVPPDRVLHAGDLQLDIAAHRATAKDKPVQLGPTEFRLLEFFMRNPNRAFDRAQLLDRVWGRNVYVEERTVDVHVLRLRKALAPHGCDRMIETVRGVGYRFVAD